ncbi:MAG: cation transporter [Acidimicrobiia bacterium]|nr:cation transporter [Acidimicrobiia bacterium]
MKVQILYFEGCPNHGPAVELVRSVLADTGLDADIEEINVEHPEQVDERRFLGSPSIQVDGIDVEPEARRRTDFGYCCRTYAGGAGLPGRDVVVAAIDEASGLANGGRGLGASVGSVLAALGASACCWVPLLAVAFGASAGGASAFLDRWRPWLIGLAVALLGFAFYSVYFRQWRNSCCETGACAPRRDRLQAINRAMVWGSAVMVGGLIMFPKWGPVVFNRTDRAPLVVPSDSVKAMTLDIEGMTCEMCVVHVVRELRDVPGVVSVRASYERGTAELQVDETAAPTAETLSAAVQRAGYTMRNAHAPDGAD